MPATDKIYLCLKLNEKELQKAIRADANVLICLEQDENIKVPEYIRIVDAGSYRVQGTWLTYAGNVSAIHSLQSKYRDFFRIGQYDLGPALAKTVYWSNYKKGSLQACYNDLPQPKTCVNERSFLYGRYIREILRYLKIQFRAITTGNTERLLKNATTCDVAILVNDAFELDLYKSVIAKIKNKRICIFHYGNIQTDDNTLAYIDLSGIHKTDRFRFINPLKLSLQELSVFNIILGKWNQLATELLRYQSIAESRAKVLLMNVAENIPERNLVRSVLGRDTIVCNTMNGMKSGEAQDADVHFDCWFVWDEQMREMMVRTCGLDPEILKVSGHLSEERISEWENHNNFHSVIPAGKKVISIFSVRGKSAEKKDVFRDVYALCVANPDLFVIVKPHPLEHSDDYIHPESEIKDRVYFVPENLKNDKSALYDQLQLSDISIVFGSTVALESKWMGTPCLTVEYKENSLIYCAGSELIAHIRDRAELSLHLNQIKHKLSVQNRKSAEVSLRIAEWLMKFSEHTRKTLTHKS